MQKSEGNGIQAQSPGEVRGKALPGEVSFPVILSREGSAQRVPVFLWVGWGAGQGQARRHSTKSLLSGLEGWVQIHTGWLCDLGKLSSLSVLQFPHL